MDEADDDMLCSGDFGSDREEDGRH
jgi:hypothetical protein